VSVLLMFAALHAHVQLVAKLLRRGASVDHQNSDGSTALMGATEEAAAEAAAPPPRRGARQQPW